MTPGTRVALTFNPAKTGVVTANHKCGVLVLLDTGGHRYYDRTWLVRIERAEQTIEEVVA